MAKEIPFAKGLGASLVEKSLAFKALLYSEQCLSVGLYSKAAQQAQECAELSMKAGTKALHGTKFKHLNRQHDLKVLAKPLKVAAITKAAEQMEICKSDERSLSRTTRFSDVSKLGTLYWESRPEMIYRETDALRLLNLAVIIYNKVWNLLLPRVKAFIQSEANQGRHETSFANGVIANTSMGVHFKRAEDHPEPTKAKQNQPDAAKAQQNHPEARKAQQNHPETRKAQQNHPETRESQQNHPKAREAQLNRPDAA